MRRTLLALAALGCLATSASAADLVFGAESDLWFDDNVYGTTNGEVSDFSWTLAPTLELSERWQTVTGVVNVRPSYELYFDENRLRGFNYDADGSLEWRPTERLSFALADSLMRYRTLRGFNQALSQPVLAGRDRFLNNTAQFIATYRTSPLGTLRLSAAHALWNFTQGTRPDQSSASAALQYSRFVTKRVRLGGRASFARQSFDQPSGTTDTDYVNGSLTFSFAPAETFTFDASAGPTWVHRPSSRFVLPPLTRGNLIRRNGAGTPLVGIPGSCPELANGQPFDGPGCIFQPFTLSPSFLLLTDPIALQGGLPQAGGDDWTYFADVALTKEWDTASLSFSYRRDQGSTSAIGFSSIADTVQASSSYRLSQRLSLTLTAGWESREETQRLLAPGRVVTVLGTLPLVNNLVPVALAIPAQRERVRSLHTSLGGRYALNERSSVGAVVGWTDQDATISSSFGDMSRLYLKLGFDYAFEPLRW